MGVTKAFFNKLRVDANMFRRDVNNYADDSQLLSTGISFPIAFRKAIIYGAEGKLEIPHWGPFSGFASYSYIVGNAWNPVTGGLFLGDDAASALTQTTGHFPDSQDQRQHGSRTSALSGRPALVVRPGMRLQQRTAVSTGFNSPAICDRIRPGGDQSPQFQSRPHQPLLHAKCLRWGPIFSSVKNSPCGSRAISQT